MKHAFELPNDYGADLDDIMYQTGRSNAGASDSSSRKRKGLGGPRSSSKALQRKSTMKIAPMNNTLDALAFTSGE